jgi:hypothetical protein
VADRRSVDKALAALHAFRAETDSMWPDDERAINAAIAVLQKYGNRRRTY